MPDHELDELGGRLAKESERWLGTALPETTVLRSRLERRRRRQRGVQIAAGLAAVLAVSVSVALWQRSFAPHRHDVAAPSPPSESQEFQNRLAQPPRVTNPGHPQALAEEQSDLTGELAGLIVLIPQERGDGAIEYIPGLLVPGEVEPFADVELTPTVRQAAAQLLGEDAGWNSQETI
jgi:hypothetical protein